MVNLARRLERLEATDRRSAPVKPFLWPLGQALDDALNEAGLSLEQSIVAIRLVGPEGTCPVHDLDLHRLP